MQDSSRLMVNNSVYLIIRFGPYQMHFTNPARIRTKARFQCRCAQQTVWLRNGAFAIAPFRWRNLDTDRPLAGQKTSSSLLTHLNCKLIEHYFPSILTYRRQYAASYVGSRRIFLCPTYRKEAERGEWIKGVW